VTSHPGAKRPSCATNRQRQFILCGNVFYTSITSDLNEISFRNLRKGEIWFSGVNMMGVCNVISTELLMCCYYLATERYTSGD
jgi:hypothetical protein